MVKKRTVRCVGFWDKDFAEAGISFSQSTQKTKFRSPTFRFDFPTKKSLTYDFYFCQGKHNFIVNGFLRHFFLKHVQTETHKKTL